MVSFRRISALVAVLIPLFLSNPECSADNAGRPGISAGMAWCKVDDPDKKLAHFPARPRVGVAIDAVYRYCQLCSTGFAMDFGYHWDSAMLRSSDTVIYGSKAVKEGPGYSPFNWALGFIHEFHYGNFAAFCGCSRYLFRKVGIHENQARFFQRAGMRFYFPRLSNTFLGMCIRATKFNNADFFEFQMGIRI